MRETTGWARELLAGNGILLEYDAARFVADSQAIYSYEGTREVNPDRRSSDHRRIRLRRQVTPRPAGREGADSDHASVARTNRGSCRQIGGTAHFRC